MRRALIVSAVVASIFLGGVAKADGPLGDNGSLIRTSHYSIDLAGGPVIAGPRVVGLGGAYVAIAEGVDGDVQNPASPAVRAAWSKTRTDWDATLGLLFPGTLANTDFYNTGRGRTDLRRSDQREFALLSPAGNLQLGPWGIGLGLEVLRFGLLRHPNPSLGGEAEVVRAQFSTFRTFLARAVDDGQLVGGLGLHVTALDVTTKDEIFTRSGNVFTTRGISFEGGLLWRPSNQPFRTGFSIRAPVTTEVDSRGQAVGGDIVLRDPASPNAIWLPRRVKRPWSSDAGFALQLGPRPLNVPWLDPVRVMRRVDAYLERREAERERQLERARELGPDRAALRADQNAGEGRDDELYRERQRARVARLLRERYDHLPRSYLLVSVALHSEGELANAVGIESFLQGVVDRSGEHVTHSPRLGLEGEPVQRWLKLRAGSYWEPTRFRDNTGRAHVTGGGDVRLFSWSLFGLLDDDDALQLSLAGDFARDYFGWALSLGVWR